MALKIRGFKLADYAQVKTLWSRSGLKPSLGDDLAHIRIKLTRDAELFLVAEQGGTIVGSVIGAWDGRRGWLYHLGVLPGHQREGVARILVAAVERRMKRKGVLKVNALVFRWNRKSLAFFKDMGYLADRRTIHHGKILAGGRRKSSSNSHR